MVTVGEHFDHCRLGVMSIHNVDHIYGSVTLTRSLSLWLQQCTGQSLVLLQVRIDHLSFSEFHVPVAPELCDCAVIDSDDDFDSAAGTVQSSLHEHLEDCDPNLRPPSPPYSLRQRSILTATAIPHGRMEEPPAVVQSPAQANVRRKNGNWSTASLEAALRALDAGYKLREVARHFDIPPSSLSDHAYGKTVNRKRGREGVLRAEEEGLLVQYLLDMAALGYPLSMGQLKLKVATMV